MRIYAPSRQLRSSSDNRILCVPSFKTKNFGQRSFSYAGPVIQNKLPYDIRTSQSKTSFKQALKKIHLFSTHYQSQGFRPVCYTCCRLSIPAWLYLLCPPPSPPPFLSFLISVVGCCTVVGCLRVLCCRRCCCPVVHNAIVKRFEPKRDGALQKSSFLLLLLVVVVVVVSSSSSSTQQ